MSWQTLRRGRSLESPRKWQKMSAFTCGTVEKDAKPPACSSKPSAENVLNPLYQIRHSCGMVETNAKFVTINRRAIERAAVSMASSDSALLRDGVEWDASGWHYSSDVSSLGPLTCQYVFVLDALNFCFWPTEGLEYDTLAMSLKARLESDSTSFDAIKLAKITPEELTSWFPSTHALPEIEERVARLQELGQALLEGNKLLLNILSYNYLFITYFSCLILFVILLSYYFIFKRFRRISSEYGCSSARLRCSLGAAASSVHSRFQGYGYLSR